MVDVDGVISLFGQDSFASGAGGEGAPGGSFHSIEGIPHFLSSTAAAHLLGLAELFDLVWASGWEERADEHLPHLLGLPARLPFLRFGRGARGVRAANAHWKLQAIEDYAGSRPLAWVDDALNDACREWARERSARSAPTLLVQTAPERGLTECEAQQLQSWARALARA